jgi:hypothetical protein
MPMRRILLRTVSSIRGVNLYLSQSGDRDGKNSPGANLSVIKIARKILWWFLFPENKICASSSRPRIRVIVLWFSSIFVLGIFHPCFFNQKRALERVGEFFGNVKIFLARNARITKIVLSPKPCDSVKMVPNKMLFAANRICPMVLCWIFERFSVI